MAMTYGFFDARQSTGGTYDRVYTAEQMSKYFKGIFTDGVLMNVGGMLAVSASSGMIVQVATGRAFLDSRWMENDTILDLTVSDAHAILNRIDIVVARLDYDGRLIEIVIKTGTSASTPEAPTITRNASYYELELAEIYIAAGTTEITQSMITDKRSDQDVCGYVTGAITQIDTQTFWTQLQDAFLTWFNEMKDQLDEDAAGHLQLEIDNILSLMTTVEPDATDLSKGYKAGEYCIANNKLYRFTQRVFPGDAIVAGTYTSSDNAVETTLNKELSTDKLWYYHVPVEATTGQIVDIIDSRITPQHVLAEITWADESKITSLTQWTTNVEGHFSIGGSASAATECTVLLVRANVIEDWSE